MTRYPHTTGCGTSYVRESWKDNTSYCARKQKFGDVLGLAEDVRAVGEPSWIVGVAIMLGFAAVVLAVAVMS